MQVFRRFPKQDVRALGVAIDAEPMLDKAEWSCQVWPDEQHRR